MKANNLTFYFLLVIIAAISSLFLPWGTFTAETGSSYLIGEKITSTGMNGYLRVAFLSIPHWFLVIIFCVATLIPILKLKKIIQVNNVIPILMDFFVLFFLMVGLYFYFNMNGIHLGLILMVAATLFSLILLILNKKMLK